MDFIKSATKPDEYIVDNLSEICFIGRSNVGKSSLINAIANQQIARTSNTPGRTQLINYFTLPHGRLVDLPGYGFAKISKQQQADIAKMVGEYITKAPNLVAIFQICDINVVTPLDAEMAFLFHKTKLLHYVILNKTDKLKLHNYEQQVSKIAAYLNISSAQILLVSAKHKTNIKTLNAWIKNALVINGK